MARSWVALARRVAALARNSERSEGAEGMMTYFRSEVSRWSGNFAGSMKSSSTKRSPVASPASSNWARSPLSTRVCRAARSATSRLAPFSSEMAPLFSSQRTAAIDLPVARSYWIEIPTTWPTRTPRSLTGEPSSRPLTASSK